jgi:hypothetical protein
MEAEQTIRNILNCLWATTGKVDPERFAIGVDSRTWKDLSQSKGLDEMTMTVDDRVFWVIPLAGLPTVTVALVWRGGK